ncbi:MAG: DNA mismatch repair protein [Salinirussus sp.]
MQLEDYWGVGPKTRDLLAGELGVEAAIEAIENADVRALTGAGLSRGRATRILRHAHGGGAMDLLATRDTRDVYKSILDIVAGFAVTDAARDRIRILTPLAERADVADRLDAVAEARDSWTALSEQRRETVLDAFAEHDGGDRAAVETALALKRTGVEGGVFSPLADIDAETLEDAASALAGLDAGSGDRVGEGADEELDGLRERLGAVEDMAATPGSVVETVESGARGADELREAFVRHVADGTGVGVGRVRESMPAESTDARAFVGETLRSLADDLRKRVENRERAVRERLQGALDDARPAIDAAVEAVDDIAFAVSLARFAIEYDLIRPELVEAQALGVLSARNLFLAADDEPLQPVSYGVGEHGLSSPGPTDPPQDRVAVLTGANSGGKTTLLETLCQIQLLAEMGLPVPAERAAVGPVDAIVFHRRHASFNAGVLESTLRSVVPPLGETGRTLMLVDEFEAITEPGSAADLLHGLVTLTVDSDALGVFVTHLAEDLEPLPGTARVDGIFAEGLTPDLDLDVDYQPRFGTVGRSTPEFIVSRLIADAGDRAERAHYETLAESIGETAVQRTLADAHFRS